MRRAYIAAALYTVELIYIEDCTTDPSAIRVRFAPADAGSTEVAAECIGTDIDYAFPPADPFTARHFMLVQQLVSFPPQVQLSPSLNWDTSPPVVLVFGDGFESGDLSAWDETAP